MAATNNQEDQHGIGLDVGARRIGIATARLDIRMAGPLGTLDKPEQFIEDIIEQCESHNAAWVVIGLPRGMEGQETAQTARVQSFGKQLEVEFANRHLNTPVYWIDEALTSVKAEAELSGRGKGHKVFPKGDVDALAATYILEDFLASHDAEDDIHG